MDPAYVHITQRSVAEHARLKRALNAHGVYPWGGTADGRIVPSRTTSSKARALVADFDTPKA